MTDFLDGIGLKDLQVDAFDRNLTDKLSAAIDYTLENPIIVRKRFAEARSKMRKDLLEFNEKISDLFGSK